MVLDFNGEYTRDQLVDRNQKRVITLDTRTQGTDKFPLDDDEFWDAETLSVLFQATTITQRPFLNRVISGRQRYIQVSK